MQTSLCCTPALFPPPPLCPVTTRPCPHHPVTPHPPHRALTFPLAPLLPPAALAALNASGVRICPDSTVSSTPPSTVDGPASARRSARPTDPPPTHATSPESVVRSLAPPSADTVPRSTPAGAGRTPRERLRQSPIPSMPELRPEGAGAVADCPESTGATWGARGLGRTRVEASAGELSADLWTAAAAAWANEPWTARARRSLVGSPAHTRTGGSAARPGLSGALAGSLQSRVGGPQGIGAFPMGRELAADPATEGGGRGRLDWNWECWARNRSRWPPIVSVSGSWLGRAKEPHARRMAEGVRGSGSAPSSAVTGGGAWGAGEEGVGSGSEGREEGWRGWGGEGDEWWRLMPCESLALIGRSQLVVIEANSDE